MFFIEIFYVFRSLIALQTYNICLKNQTFV